MTKLEAIQLQALASSSDEFRGGQHSHSSSSAGNLSSASSMDFKLSSASSNASTSNCSIPSHLSTSSSLDSALIWFYTSCLYKNLPYKPLSAISCRSSISSICITSNNLLVAGTSSTGIQAFHVSSSSEMQKLDLEHPLGVSSGSVKFLLQIDQSQVLSGHQSGSIKIWEDSTQQKKKLRLAGTLPTKIQSAANFFLPNSYVQVRRHRKTLWIQHADAVSCLAASPEFIFSVSWDRSLKVWRSSDMKCLQSIKSAHDDAINSVAAHDQFVYTAGADGKIKAWEVSGRASGSGKNKLLSRIAVLDRHSSSVNALAVDAATGHLYSASSDKSICVWEREDAAMHMTPVDCLKGHSMAVLCLAGLSFSDSSSSGSGDLFLLCSGSADKTVRLWSRDRISGVHSCLSVLRGHLGPVKSVAIPSADAAGGALVFSGSLDCQVRAWSVSLHEPSPPQHDDEASNRVAC